MTISEDDNIIQLEMEEERDRRRAVALGVMPLSILKMLIEYELRRNDDYFSLKYINWDKESIIRYFVENWDRSVEDTVLSYLKIRHE